MKREVNISILFSLFFWSAFALPSFSFAANPEILIKTNMGMLQVELYEDKAPVTVKNFLTYMGEGSYNGTIFHRVIQGFIIQGGHYDVNLSPRTRKSPIINEAGNGLKNERGTLGMSRRIGKDSATNQFYINLNDNPVLNHVDESDQGYGYAVFGKITKGLEIIKKIEKIETRRKGVFPKLPVKNVIIETIQIKKK